MTGAREPDLFMQVIHEKNLRQEPLTHIEIELLRQRRSGERFEEQFETLNKNVGELVEIWRAASGTLRFIKLVGVIAGVIAAVLGALKLGSSVEFKGP